MEFRAYREISELKPLISYCYTIVKLNQTVLPEDTKMKDRGSGEVARVDL